MANKVGNAIGSVPLSEEERRACVALAKLAATWPKSLWLYAAAGTMHVMRYGPDGRRAITADGGVDQAFSVFSTRAIVSDGGDW